MGLLRRMFGNHEPSGPNARAVAADHVRAQVEDPSLDLVELSIVGEGPRQAALEKLAGPKGPEGKQVLVGVTLRCDPTNEHDNNAVRVEVMGQHVGFIERDLAAVLAPPMQRECGGVLEARGLIVGGWRDARSEGHYGLRAWISAVDATLLGIPPSDDRAETRERLHAPALPDTRQGERRLSPTPADVRAGRFAAEVTVVSEEHYQEAVIAALPEGWTEERRWCPALAELDIAPCNPHAKQGTPCVEVRIGGRTIGFLTPAMTARYASLIESVKRDGLSPTAAAGVHVGRKAGTTCWQVTIAMPKQT